MILTLLFFHSKQEEQEDISSSLTEQNWEKNIPEPLSWRSDEEDEDSDFGEEQRDCYLKVLSRFVGPTPMYICACVCLIFT